MNYFLLKLAFDTAVHFGGSDSAVGSQSSALTLLSTTHFSASPDEPEPSLPTPPWFAF